MSNTYTEATATKLRSIVARIEEDIAQTPPSAALRSAWTELVGVLALGPAPETRECPACHAIGMRAASRCGQCWIALEKLPPLSQEVSS